MSVKASVSRGDRATRRRRDPDDDHAIACANAARADAIVSGDHHQLAMCQHQRVDILTAGGALARSA